MLNKHVIFLTGVNVLSLHQLRALKSTPKIKGFILEKAFRIFFVFTSH